MNWVGNTQKFYVDQQLPNYQQLANAAQVQFPHLRFGIGPANLNDHYLGADKQQIEDFLTNFSTPLQNAPGEPSGLRKQNNELAELPFQPGDLVLVSMQGIGDVEARFVRALQGNQVLIDLDGIEESIDASIVTRFDPNKPPTEVADTTAAPPAPQITPPEQAAAPAELPTTDATSPEPSQA
jgi:hypothetical protein